ncbi:MAG: cyclase family protein [Gammaproteobacteria bacterium]|jgi:kynurenine formamidase|nr:cyclase family protein [Gammaproteobacteria bacterium]
MLKNVQLIDLTHEVFEGMPQWPGKCPFHESVAESHEDAGAFVNSYEMSSGCSTHMDAPVHFVKGGRSISDFSLEELFNPAVIINLQSKVASNPDYVLSIEDVQSWEHQYGVLPARALVIANTGWYKRWPDPIQFLNKDANGVMRFPGFSAEVAEYLLEKNIAGIGIDTLSLDCGIEHDYPVHKIILGADKFQLELLANLDALPESGAYIFTLPTKFKGAPEAPARVVGFVSLLP